MRKSQTLNSKRFWILVLMAIWVLPGEAFAGAYETELSNCLMQARSTYNNAQYKEAAIWWKKVLILDPQNKEALQCMRKLQSKIKVPQRPKPAAETKIVPEKVVAPAKERITPRQEMSPATIAAKTVKLKERSTKYILQGKKYYCQHMYKWAIDEWEKALLVDPGNIEVADYIERARARLKQKPAEQKPVETDMMIKAPSQPPQAPEPVFKKPKGDTIALDEAIKLGVTNHLPIQIAREQVDLARFKEREAFRELFPQATVRWDESSGVVSDKNYTGRKYNLKVQHPLYHGGELRYTWEQAKVNLRIAKENYDKSKEDFTVELTKAYYDLAKTTRNFSIQENLLKELELDLSMAKKEFDQNVSTLVDFLNVQSQYNQAYYAYLSSENTRALAKSNFLQLLNLDKDPSAGDIKIDAELVFKEYNIDLEKCISLAYENRTDLKINELSLKSSELGEKVTKSQQLPRIDLTGTVGKSGEAFTPGNIQLSDDWFIGAKVSMPWGPNTMNYSYTNEQMAPSITVFGPTKDTVNSVRFNILDNLAGYTEGKRSEIVKEQAYSDLLKGKQTAATEVREAYFNYQESVIKVKNSLANKELYQKELAIIKQKRLMDETQTQDVVSAKVKLASEEINYNSALVENVLAIVKLNKAMGVKNYFKSESNTY